MHTCHANVSFRTDAAEQQIHQHRLPHRYPVTQHGTAHCLMQSAQRTAHSAQRTAHSAQRTAHSAQRTAHSAQRKAQNAHGAYYVGTHLATTNRTIKIQSLGHVWCYPCIIIRRDLFLPELHTWLAVSGQWSCVRDAYKELSLRPVIMQKFVMKPIEMNKRCTLSGILCTCERINPNASA